MRSNRFVLFALLVSCHPGETAAAAPITFDGPAGTLGASLAVIGEKTGLSIGVFDAEVAARPIKRLSGTMTAGKAIQALARQARACVRRVDAEAFRVEKCPMRAVIARPQLSLISDPTTEQTPIVVIASKRGVPRSEYPGSVIILGAGGLDAAVSGLAGTSAVVSRLPSLASTNLGPGRNKLFIRGIADSSFNGPTQATVGQYFGDIRLNYNAPDPDLVLYDTSRVEVLEGPQGTLYGAGSLGGIFRIVPAEVDLTAVHGSAMIGRSSMAHGAPGGDAAAMLNLPLAADVLGIRGVVYRSVDGGYIDDIGRGLTDINRTRTIGGRVAVKARLPGDWSILLSAILQNIDSQDGQYTEAGLPPLDRSSATAQPFDNDYSLGSLSATRSWGDIRLVTVASATRHHVTSTYDFTPAGALPQLFVQKNDIALYSGETRLSRNRADGSGWLIGASLIYDDEKLIRSLGPQQAPQRIAGVRNTILDGAVFGEATFRIAPTLLITGGGRLAITRLGGEGLDQPASTTFEPSRRQVRLLPSLGLSWQPEATSITVYARAQEGFRPGGLEVNGDTATDVQQFQGDLITTWELGARFGRDAVNHLTIDGSLSYSRWQNIQADLVTAAGQPYTTNIGSGRVIGAELRLGWRPWAGATLEASAFANDSTLVHSAPGFAGSDASSLPNIPALGGRASMRIVKPVKGAWVLTADIAGRYIGRSRLGVGPLLNIPQGKFFDADSSIRLGTDRHGISIGVSNMLDSAANTFSLGDPFTVGQRLQRTPLRPRRLRIGIDARF